MKDFIRKSLIILAILLLVSFVLVEGIILMEGKKAEPPRADYVIVLGARLYGDLPSPALMERLRVARDYLLENGDSIAVVTGGQGTDELIPEAHAMKNFLVEIGGELYCLGLNSQGETWRIGIDKPIENTDYDNKDCDRQI